MFTDISGTARSGEPIEVLFYAGFYEGLYLLRVVSICQGGLEARSENLYFWYNYLQ